MITRYYEQSRQTIRKQLKRIAKQLQKIKQNNVEFQQINVLLKQINIINNQRYYFRSMNYIEQFKQKYTQFKKKMQVKKIILPNIQQLSKNISSIYIFFTKNQEVLSKSSQKYIIQQIKQVQPVFLQILNQFDKMRPNTNFQLFLNKVILINTLWKQKKFKYVNLLFSRQQYLVNNLNLTRNFMTNQILQDLSIIHTLSKQIKLMTKYPTQIAQSSLQPLSIHAKTIINVKNDKDDTVVGNIITSTPLFSNYYGTTNMDVDQFLLNIQLVALLIQHKSIFDIYMMIWTIFQYSGYKTLFTWVELIYLYVYMYKSHFKQFKQLQFNYKKRPNTSFLKYSYPFAIRKTNLQQSILYDSFFQVYITLGAQIQLKNISKQNSLYDFKTYRQPLTQQQFAPISDKQKFNKSFQTFNKKLGQIYVGSVKQYNLFNQQLQKFKKYLFQSNKLEHKIRQNSNANQQIVQTIITQKNNSQMIDQKFEKYQDQNLKLSKQIKQWIQIVNSQQQQIIKGLGVVQNMYTVANPQLKHQLIYISDVFTYIVSKINIQIIDDSIINMYPHYIRSKIFLQTQKYNFNVTRRKNNVIRYAGQLMSMVIKKINIEQLQVKKTIDQVKKQFKKFSNYLQTDALNNIKILYQQGQFLRQRSNVADNTQQSVRQLHTTINKKFGENLEQIFKWQLQSLQILNQQMTLNTNFIKQQFNSFKQDFKNDLKTAKIQILNKIDNLQKTVFTYFQQTATFLSYSFAQLKQIAAKHGQKIQKTLGIVQQTKKTITQFKQSFQTWKQSFEKNLSNTIQTIFIKYMNANNNAISTNDKINLQSNIQKIIAKYSQNTNKTGKINQLQKSLSIIKSPIQQLIKVLSSGNIKINNNDHNNNIQQLFNAILQQQKDVKSGIDLSYKSILQQIRQLMPSVNNNTSNGINQTLVTKFIALLLDLARAMFDTQSRQMSLLINSLQLSKQQIQFVKERTVKLYNKRMNNFFKLVRQNFVNMGTQNQRQRKYVNQLLTNQAKRWTPSLNKKQIYELFKQQMRQL